MVGMADVSLATAWLERPRGEDARVAEHSADWADAWTGPALALLHAFGEPPPGAACLGGTFAHRLANDAVAIVQVLPTPAGTPLRAYVVGVGKSTYIGFGADPFAIAERCPPQPRAETVACPAIELASRDGDRIRAILSRVKAHALPADVDVSEADLERTPANSESPTLLGATQVLVDGGNVVLSRAAPDPRTAASLWALLPYAVRAERWPASFAYSPDLAADLLVLAESSGDPPREWLSEDQAGDYPAGAYELALQRAAEAGDDAALERLFHRRDGSATLWLGVKLVVGLALVALATQLWRPAPPPLTPRAVAERAALAAGAVAVRDPLAAAALVDFGNRKFLGKDTP